MKIVDNGVLDPSFMDFTTPSDFAKQNLYCTPQFGHFYCNQYYHIKRDYLDLFLLLYVCRGTLHLEVDGHHYIAGSNQILLLDCRQPHYYYCNDSVEFLWFHFTGNNSIQYVEFLNKQNDMIYSGNHIDQLREHFDAVLSYAMISPLNEHRVSMNILQILAKLAAPAQHIFVSNHFINPAVQYINAHYEEPIDLAELAAACNVSPSQLIRNFKKYLNCTPHNYLLGYRLRQSKQLLVTTSMSIEEIAEKCGFNSASHYARAFRAKETISPSEFRNMRF